MKKILFFLFLLSIVQQLQAQEQFIPKGKITFEKSVNMLRKLDDWDSDFKDKIKKYQTSNWEYAFNENQSLYKAAKKETRPGGNDLGMIFIGGSDAADAQVFIDFNKNTRTVKKQISGADYLLDDSIPKLEWKIQQDVRVIAGYECRKAIARFNDTVYVVAFYTDKILTKGGPEGFTGLPGMILGLAIPRYFTTWFATKVEVLPENLLTITAPAKGERPSTDKKYKEMVDLLTRYDSYEFGKVKQTAEQIHRRLYSLVL